MRRGPLRVLGGRQQGGGGGAVGACGRDGRPSVSGVDWRPVIATVCVASEAIGRSCAGCRSASWRTVASLSFAWRTSVRKAGVPGLTPSSAARNATSAGGRAPAARFGGAEPLVSNGCGAGERIVARVGVKTLDASLPDRVVGQRLNGLNAAFPIR